MSQICQPNLANYPQDAEPKVLLKLSQLPSSSPLSHPNESPVFELQQPWHSQQVILLLNLNLSQIPKKCKESFKGVLLKKEISH